MRKVAVIAWREFRSTVFTWTFLLGVAVVPLMGLATSLAVPLLAGATGAFEVERLEGTVLVVGAPELATALEGEAEEGLAIAQAALLEPALERLERREVLGVVDHAEAPTLYLAEGGRILERNNLSEWVASAEARRRTAAAGLDIDQVRALVQPQPPRIVTLGAKGKSDDAVREVAKLVVGVVGEMLLWLGVFVSGQYLLQGMIEERSSKVVEVLLSAVTPLELMAGKILGLGLVGALLTLAYGFVLVASLAAMAQLDLLGLGDLLIYLLFYVLAYLQAGSVFIAIGSAVNEPREAQSLMTPAVLVFTMALLSGPMIMFQPHGPLAVALSFVPPLSPYVMIMRVLEPDQSVPLWQLLLSLALCAACAAAMLWAAARVFRVGVLMRGKAPSPLELARWIWEP